MSARKYTHGMTVFDIDGNTYSYIGTCDAGHAVEAVYDDDDGVHFSGPTWLREVFAEPPRQRLASDLSDLKAEIDAKRAELQQIQLDVFAAENERRAIAERAKRNPKLADLHLWLEGKATHLVVMDHYRVEVGTIDEMLRSNDRDRMLRLLSLYVDPKEERFYVARAAYSDGSGSQTACRLASSEEHAHELAREYIASQMRDPNNGWNSENWTRAAIRYGMRLPEQRLAALKASERKALTERIARAQSTRDVAVADLLAAQQELDKLSA